MNIDKFNNLKSKWLAFQAENPKIRIRDAAKKMHISEAELLSTEIDDGVSFLLIDNFKDFIKDVLMIDQIMFLIRNDIVVHEKTIKTRDVELIGNQIVNIKDSNSILLEFDEKLFKYAFFQKKIHANRELRSFQFFNNLGHATLKIYLKSKDSDAFEDIALKYESKYNYEIQSELNLNKAAHLESEINIHLPFSIDRNKVTESEMPLNSLRLILESASDMKIPILIYGFGLGAVQYHMDTVRNIVDYGPWLNVIDKKFNLHVLESGLFKAILIQCDCNKQKCCIVDFFDKNNTHVLGVSSTYEYESDFLKIINNIKE